MTVFEPVHPRDHLSLEHIESQALAVEQALARGRMHHAWLLTGPEGVGKASFAYRVARRLLGAAAAEHSGALGVAEDDPVSRLISAQSHPDLLVLERDMQGAKRVIPVDQARQLPEFFAKAPALGGFRVCIVDAADDLNVNAANAVLKTLEEPPERGVLLMISHAPGGLLSTIRSRCRRLTFSRWTDEAVAAFAARTLGLGDEEAERLAAMAGGSPGRAVALSGGGTELDAVVDRIVDGLPARPAEAIQTLTDGFRGGEGAGRFALLVERVGEAVRRRALREPRPMRAAAWAEAWGRCARLTSEVEGLNLDRADAFTTLISDLASAARA